MYDSLANVLRSQHLYTGIGFVH